jgi:hypothetical protein
MRAGRQNIDSARLAGKIFRVKELASLVVTVAGLTDFARTVPIFLFLFPQ